MTQGHNIVGEQGLALDGPISQPRKCFWVDLGESFSFLRCGTVLFRPARTPADSTLCHAVLRLSVSLRPHGL